jgi:anti-sigma factor RsiW
VPGSERAHLQQWLTKRCGWDVFAPELGSTGLKLVGGRLLPGPAGPASFLMYESASGERFTVYTAKASTETTQMRFTTQDKDGALFWADRGVGYVVSGTSDRERLTQVARMVYDQAEKNGG